MRFEKTMRIGECLLTSLDQVKAFWNEHPLWAGESKHEPGCIEFFVKHRSVYISDYFSGTFDIRFYPCSLDPMDKYFRFLISVVELVSGLQNWVCVASRHYMLRTLLKMLPSSLVEDLNATVPKLNLPCRMQYQ